MRPPSTRSSLSRPTTISSGGGRSARGPSSAEARCGAGCFAGRIAVYGLRAPVAPPPPRLRMAAPAAPEYLAVCRRRARPRRRCPLCRRGEMSGASAAHPARHPAGGVRDPHLRMIEVPGARIRGAYRRAGARGRHTARQTAPAARRRQAAMLRPARACTPGRPARPCRAK